jgi:perosamine synthetase
MVVSNDKTLHARMVHYKGQGLAAHREYWHDVIGFNYRMTNICAAIGLAQLEQLDAFVARKREIGERYRRNLAGSPVTCHGEAPGTTHSYWMCSTPFQRHPVAEDLGWRGINLPSWPGLGDDQVDFICEEILRFLKSAQS